MARCFVAIVMMMAASLGGSRLAAQDCWSQCQNYDKYNACTARLASEPHFDYQQCVRNSDEASAQCMARCQGQPKGCDSTKNRDARCEMGG